MYLEFLKITAPIVFNQRFEPGTLVSEYQCSSTVPSWDLYVRSGDNVVNAKAREKLNRSKLVPCRPIRFSATNYRYQSEATYRPYANTCSIATHIHW